MLKANWCYHCDVHHVCNSRQVPLKITNKDIPFSFSSKTFLISPNDADDLESPLNSLIKQSFYQTKNNFLFGLKLNAFSHLNDCRYTFSGSAHLAFEADAKTLLLMLASV